MIVVADNVMYVFSHSISGLVLGLHFWILVTVDLYVVVTPRVCGGVKQLLLFVCQSVCLSVRPSFCPFRARDLQGLVIAQPGRNIAIWKKSMQMYLIVTKAGSTLGICSSFLFNVARFAIFTVENANTAEGGHTWFQDTYAGSIYAECTRTSMDLRRDRKRSGP